MSPEYVLRELHKMVDNSEGQNGTALRTGQIHHTENEGYEETEPGIQSSEWPLRSICNARTGNRHLPGPNVPGNLNQLNCH